jgi:hypothetical protein
LLINHVTEIIMKRATNMYTTRVATYRSIIDPPP